MPYAVDFDKVSTVGLESSPVAAALAGLRAHEARYFKTNYNHVFKVDPAAKAKNAIALVERILKDERDVVISSRRSKRQPSRSRTFGWHMGSTQVVSRSM